MYELNNRRYGWSKFSSSCRPNRHPPRGVYKSLRPQEHFAGEYNKKIRFFI